MHRYVGEQFIVNEFKDLEFECEANSKLVSFMKTQRGSLGKKKILMTLNINYRYSLTL